MAVRRPDQIPPWQVTADGYESPTESTFEELKKVYSLRTWVEGHADEAPNVLGGRNTRLREPKTRLYIWPVEVRHTPFQLRAIWKYCNESCHNLAPYAFNAEKRPYSEFSWIVYSTKARFGDDATQAIAERPAPVLAIPANTGNQTRLSDNRPPPNAPRGPRGGLNNPIPHPVYSSRPAPSAPVAPSGLRSNENRTPFQAVQTPASRPPAANGLSAKQGKAPLRSRELSHTLDTVHPSRRPLIDTTAIPSAVAQEHASAQNHPDRARHSQASAHQLPTPVSGPSKFPTTLTIRSSVPRRTPSPSQSTTYSPTPGPSSRNIRPPTKRILSAESPYSGDNKTPGPTEDQKQVASSELGTPSLYSSGKHLLPAVAQTPKLTLSARAAGKQPVRSAESPVNSRFPLASQPQARIQKPLCKACFSEHFGNCSPVCRKCGQRHQINGVCKLLCSVCSERHKSNKRCPPLCSTCNERHYGDVCKLMCTTCGKRHLGVCWELPKAHADDHPLPEDVSNQDETPEPAELNDATPSQPTLDTEPVEPTEPEDASCKHSRRDKECVACECGCGKCHRPDKKCKKQRLKNEKKANKKRKADEAALEDDADDADHAGVAEDADVADIPDDADSMDVVEIADDEEVKVEASTSPSKTIPQPKKKRKKEAKKKVKDTRGRWYNAIVVTD